MRGIGSCPFPFSTLPHPFLLFLRIKADSTSLSCPSSSNPPPPSPLLFYASRQSVLKLRNGALKERLRGGFLNMGKSKMNVYTFSKDGSDGDASMKSLLGGKGANLAEMCKIGLSVPPGFTISTEVRQTPHFQIPHIFRAA